MNLNNIPTEIQTLRQWVCTRSDSKVPMMACVNSVASSVDEQTWSTFEQARKAVEYGTYNHVGFVFNDNSIVGIDIDEGFDDDGFLTEIGADIIGKCRSYTEISKSGSGLHILLKGQLPFDGKNNLNGVEIYKKSRFFIMTGDVLLYDAIVENQSAIDYVVDKYFSSKKESEHSEDSYSDRIYSPTWGVPGKMVSLRPTYPVIPDGCRNICLTSLAGSLHTDGYCREHIYDELMHCNKVACQPPLSQREVLNIVKSVTRYKR